MAVSLSVCLSAHHYFNTLLSAFSLPAALSVSLFNKLDETLFFYVDYFMSHYFINPGELGSGCSNWYVFHFLFLFQPASETEDYISMIFYPGHFHCGEPKWLFLELRVKLMMIQFNTCQGGNQVC